MGIKSLLKTIKETERPVHVSELKNKRVGVDSYCWLHKAILTCAIELIHNKPTRKYVDYMISRVNLLLKCGCTPVMIFDGRDIPLKGETNKNRADTRSRSLQRGLQLYQCGDHQGAVPFLAQSIVVTTEMAYTVIQALRQMGVTCIVAPYEADAQLAFLAREKYIDVVITEDSDLLVYGTPVVWYKLDRNGYAIEQRYDAVRRYLASSAGFEDFEYVQFISLCILSGCDYLSSIHGIGIRKALKLVTKFSNIKEIMTALAADEKSNHSQELLEQYALGFEKAMYCFLHHIVYDPETKLTANFTPLASKSHQHGLIGDIFDAAMSKAICEDVTVDPINMSPYKSLKNESKKITKFFHHQNSFEERIISKVQKTTRKRSLQEIIECPASEKSSVSTKKSVESTSRVQVVSRFFAMPREAHGANTREQQPIQSPDPSGRSYTIITDDYVPSQTPPKTQASSTDSLLLSQSSVISVDTSVEISTGGHSNECVNSTVRKIARYVGCRSNLSSASMKSSKMLSVKSVDEIAEIMQKPG